MIIIFLLLCMISVSSYATEITPNKTMSNGIPALAVNQTHAPQPLPDLPFPNLTQSQNFMLEHIENIVDQKSKKATYTSLVIVGSVAIFITVIVKVLT